jgi:hypothetical protein
MEALWRPALAACLLWKLVESCTSQEGKNFSTSQYHKAHISIQDMAHARTVCGWVMALVRFCLRHW